MLPIIRHVVAAIGIFFALSAFGGLQLGFLLHSGDFFALTCLSAGIALACGLWWRLSGHSAYLRPFKGLFLILYCVTAGLAMYSNLAYLIWIGGQPLSIGTVAAGKMGESYWLPPATLLYAVAMFGVLKSAAKRG